VLTHVLDGSQVGGCSPLKLSEVHVEGMQLQSAYAKKGHRNCLYAYSRGMHTATLSSTPENAPLGSKR
jgi:hypothetical protein